jgi:hypothetical protein
MYQQIYSYVVTTPSSGSDLQLRCHYPSFRFRSTATLSLPLLPVRIYTYVATTLLPVPIYTYAVTTSPSGSDLQLRCHYLSFRFRSTATVTTPASGSILQLRCHYPSFRFRSTPTLSLPLLPVPITELCCFLPLFLSFLFLGRPEATIK